MTPTDRAAYYHGLRADLHIVMWKLLDSKEVKLDPWEWEWQCKNGQNLSPITTDREVAPEDILKGIGCNCKELANQCGANRCSCGKNDLPCFITCENAMEKNVKIDRVSNIFYDIVINALA